MLKPDDHVLEYLDDYLHDVLTSIEDTFIEQHLEGCRICKVALEEAEKRCAAVEALPAHEASEQLIQTTLQRVAASEPALRRHRQFVLAGMLSAAAAAIITLTVITLYYLNLAPPTHDLQVLGQTQLFAGSSASLRVRLVGYPDRHGIEGVPVTIELRKPNAEQVVQLAGFTTDASGTGQPRFRLPDWADGQYELCVTAHTAGEPEVISRTVALRRSWNLMLSSDRPVYQPGQEIHVRSLALRRPDLRPAAGQETMFTIADPKGNVIFKQKQRTSKFGIAAIDCPLAEEILEGLYTVHCRLGDTESALAVEVKKYVLPKFKVEVKLDRPYYQPGQKVSGTVQADYFFGKPVAGGKVEVELRSDGNEPKLLQRDSVRTDDKGKASFAFPSLPKLLDERKQETQTRVQVSVTVTDTAGQKQTRTLSAVVAEQPLRIEVIPEGGRLVYEIPNTIYLLVTTADGQPVKACVRIPEIDREVVTSDLGVTSFEVTPRSLALSTVLVLSIHATDDSGRFCRRKVELECGTETEDFLLRTDKAVYAGGESIRLVAVGSGEGPIFVDLLKDDQTILTAALPMRDGRGEQQLDLPPEVCGTLQLRAYRVGARVKTALRKTRVLYVRPAEQLTVRSTVGRPEYRPGALGNVSFTLTDRQGKPAPGALSLAIVDEAVFAVLNQMPGTESNHFTVEQDLLRPIQALYPWSPGLGQQGVADRNRFEQALFAHTAAATTFPTEDDEDKFIVRGRARLHPLFDSDFSANLQRWKVTREAGLTWVKNGWFVLGVSLWCLGFILLWQHVPSVRRLLALTTFVLLPCGFVFWCGNEEYSDLRVNRSYFGILQMEGLDTGDVGKASLGFGMDHRTSHHGMNFGLVNKAATPRVREWFPETLLWRPELITDDTGCASIDVPLADSITIWRLTTSAITADGKLGAAQAKIKVFQPFFVDLNLPVALTRGDEVAIPIVVYNYLDTPQQVELKLDDAPAFERLDGDIKRLDLKPREVAASSFRLRAKKVGVHHLQVTATGSGVADAIKRRVEVVPDGRRVETVWNGNLREPARLQMALPQGAVEGSARVIVKLYPSSFSQVVEGLDAIFQMPYGCFEQTSSTTYPNVLALDYLRRTGKSVPKVEAKARQYIHLGYQRLLSFEVQAGGFDWFGHPPANRALTAYGLMEFQDMAKVHEVDPQLIARTRKWLLDQRQQDGAWEPEGRTPHTIPAGGLSSDKLARLSTTAYIAWAVFSAQTTDARPTRDFLLGHRPSMIDDPHVLALVCNALLAIDPKDRAVRPYLERLDELRRNSPDGKLAWWQQPDGARTTFHGAGRSGSVETTALAVLAMTTAQHNLTATRSALAWLVQQKDSAGTWFSTQATVLALKALLAGTNTAGGDGERRIELAWDSGKKLEVVIPADQTEVMKQLDLSPYLRVGDNVLTLTEKSATAAGFQVAFRYHEAGETRRPEGPLALQVRYERERVQVGEMLPVVAQVVNRTKETAPMVMLDLPIPPGFAVVTEDFDRLVKAGTVAKYQVTARSVLVYLRQLSPEKMLEIGYSLRATMPAQVAVPAARAYEYYDPDRQAHSVAAQLTVTARP